MKLDLDPAVKAYMAKLGKRGGIAAGVALGKAGRSERARKAAIAMHTKRLLALIK